MPLHSIKHHILRINLINDVQDFYNENDKILLWGIKEDLNREMYDLYRLKDSKLLRYKISLNWSEIQHNSN